MINIKNINYKLWEKQAGAVLNASIAIQESSIYSSEEKKEAANVQENLSKLMKRFES